MADRNLCSAYPGMFSPPPKQNYSSCTFSSNPVSALVTAHLFVLPQLRRIAGLDSPHWEIVRLNVKVHPRPINSTKFVFSSDPMNNSPPHISPQLAHQIPMLDARPEYRRAILLPPPSPHFSALLPLAKCVSGHQLSSRLASARSANLLLELPPRSEQIQRLDEGSTVGQA